MDKPSHSGADRDGLDSLGGTGQRAETGVQVPDTLDTVLSPTWLSAALSRRFPGIDVTEVIPGPVISRVATNARFRIECAAGVPAGLSPHLCAKGYFTATGWPYRYSGEIEASFYKYLADSTPIRTLRSVYADVGPQDHHGVIVTEDVAAQGGTFLDPLSEYSAEQAAQSLEQLATLHGATWNRAEWLDRKFLAPRLETYTHLRGIDDIRNNFDGPIGAGVPARSRDAEQLLRSFRAVARDAATTAPLSVIHGDAHVGNLFLDNGGRPCFLDWQLVQRGPWYLDVGYHLASALTVEERRKSEDDLLRHYLDHLSAHGVDLPSYDDCRAGLRRGMIYGLYLWAITLKVDPAITAVLLERLGTAVDDHDAYREVARPAD